MAPKNPGTLLKPQQKTSLIFKDKMSNSTLFSIKDFKYAVEGILLPIVAILGILGNICLILNFWRQNQQRHIRALFITLAIFDLIFIICAYFAFSIKQFDFEFYEAHITIALPWLLPILQSALTGSVYFTIAISVERYLLVCKNK